MHYFWVIPAFVLFFLPLTAPAFEFEGPFQVRNQFPVFLPLNQPYLEQASLEDSFSLSLSHSSVFMIEDSDQWSAHLDLELTELNLRYKKRIPGSAELGIDVPVLRATGGFMDRPLEWYHRAFGFPDYNRSTRPRNVFLYSIRKDGALLVQGENDRAGFGDVRISLKKKFFETAGRTGSFLADVELPTGNPRIGYGNGSIDAGFALLMDQQISPGARLSANIGAVFPGDLKACQRLELEPYFYAGTAVEYFAWTDLSVLAQFTAQTSPFPETEISQIDTSGMLLILGGRYYLSFGSFDFSLTEDLNTSGAPDFVLNLSLKKDL